LKGLQYVLRLIITDKLKSYSAAKAEILPGARAPPT
jgi:putative transposase